MKMPRPKSIFAKILLTALPPIILLAAVLSLYAINARLDDLAQAFQERGRAHAQQLASSAILGLFTGDRDMLQTACQRQLALSSDIRKVEIRNAHQETIAQAAPPNAPPGVEGLSVFRAPVIPPLLEIGDEGGVSELPAPIGEVAVQFSQASADQAGQRIIGKALLITLLTVLLTLAIAMLVAGQIAQPIERLRRAVSDLQAGNMAARVGETSLGEIGELEQGFNSMASQIASSAQTMQQEIDRATAELHETMHALELRNVELEYSRERELEANKAKSAFLANMSHEIRTPMNGVLGFAGLLQKSQLDETQRESLDTIIRSARNLLSIINDILDFSKMEAGRLELEPIPFSLREAVEDVVGLLVPQAHEKHLRVISLIDGEVPDQLIGDVTRLRQILTNLLGNAVKFTEYGEVVINVGCRTRNAARVSLEISVSDTGIGISQDVLGQLFTPFSQGALSTRRLYGGTGLGLSICHALSEAMGGEITAHSEPGKGTCFTVTLPFPVNPDSKVAMLQVSGGASLRVAVVEPHRLSRIALTQVLESAGMRVDAMEALPDSVPSAQPDVWLLALDSRSTHADTGSSMQQLRRISPAPVCLMRQGFEAEGVSRADRQAACDRLDLPVTRRRLLTTILNCSDANRAVSRPVIEPPTEAAGWLQGRTFLVADDNPINLQLMEALLRSYGADILNARDGAEAIRLFQSQPVDMILMDVHMPNMDGREAAERIRAYPYGHAIPIVAVTADILMKGKLTTADSPFSAFLLKPVDEHRLRETIGRYMGASPVAQSAMPEDTPRPRTIRNEAEAIRIAGGSETVARELFHKLLEQLPGTLLELHRGYAARNWEDLWQSVHRLVGAAAVCGVPALHHAAEVMSAAVAAHDVTETGDRLNQLQEQAERLEALHTQAPQAD